MIVNLKQNFKRFNKVIWYLTQKNGVSFMDAAQFLASFLKMFKTV